MSLSAIRPTNAERQAINRAFYRIEELTGHNPRCAKFANDEHRGYGNKNDRVPVIAARGMCCRWFLHGFYNPSTLLRDSYWLRPAAIWFEGYGANIANTTPSVDISDIKAGLAAYDAALNRIP